MLGSKVYQSFILYPALAPILAPLATLGELAL